MFRKRGVIPLGPLTVFKCAQCGVDAYRARSALTRVKHSFCSRSCAVEFMRRQGRWQWEWVQPYPALMCMRKLAKQLKEREEIPTPESLYSFRMNRPQQKFMDVTLPMELPRRLIALGGNRDGQDGGWSITRHIPGSRGAHIPATGSIRYGSSMTRCLCPM